MTRRERLRRVAILCCTFARNLAYYRAGWPVFDRASSLHRTVNANFLDTAVLEWCKLFDRKAQQGWKNVVRDPTTFEAELLAFCGVDRVGFDAFTSEMRAYRDKFLAHLDSETVMRPPKMELAKKSVSFYYRYLLEHENNGSTYEDGPADLKSYYDERMAEGRAFYGTGQVARSAWREGRTVMASLRTNFERTAHGN